MNTIEKIHNGFDTAADTLVAISTKKKEMAESMTAPEPDAEYEDGLMLAKLGFTNVEKASRAREFDNLKSSTERTKRTIENQGEAIDKVVTFYQEKFPHHKFILYSQVLKICEKYNIILAPASFYKGDIPQKNIEDMKNFPLKRYEELTTVPQLYSSSPICAQDLIISRFSSNSIYSYICAPLNEFDTKGTSRVGYELFKEEQRGINPRNFKWHERAPKDPIVLLPVLAKELNEFGFLVLTKWGLEANDESLVVGANN